MYARTGYDDEARLTAIAKQQHRIDAGGLGPFRRLWRRLLGWTIGHGYRPTLAGVWALLAIAVLTAVFWLSPDGQLIARVAPTPPAGDAPLSAAASGWAAFGYALDVVIPVGDFAIADNWQAQGWLEPVRWLFVTLGWLLVSIFIAGFTSVVRN